MQREIALKDEAAGHLARCPVLVDIPVLWGDEDSFAHVNNVAYLRWCETARVEYMRKIGLCPESPPKGIGPIVASVTCHYRRALNYPDTVTVGTTVTRIGNSSLHMQQWLVSRATGEVAAEASATMVAFDYATGKSVPIPATVREAIARLEAAGAQS